MCGLLQVTGALNTRLPEFARRLRLVAPASPRSRSPVDQSRQLFEPALASSLQQRK